MINSSFKSLLKMALFVGFFLYAFTPQIFGADTQAILPMVPEHLRAAVSQMDLSGIDTSQIEALKNQKGTTKTTETARADSEEGSVPSTIETNFRASQDKSNFSVLLKRNVKNMSSVPEEVYWEGVDPNALNNKENTLPKQFGYDYFSNNNEAALNQKQIPVGTNYILGPGDELILYIWGKIHQNFQLTINEEGNVFIPKVGTVQLAGVKYGDVEKVLYESLKEQFTNFELSVAIAKLRTIRITILGEVGRPGTYDISALSTALMALQTAGGPTKVGSLRAIKIIRENKVLKTLDLYDFLINGNKSEDIRLEPFDTIFVPVIGKVIEMEGLVKRPGIFEVGSNETLAHILKVYAGGLSPEYYVKKVQLLRIEEGKRFVIEDIMAKDTEDLYKRLEKIKLKSGDIVSVDRIKAEQYNHVSIQGNVQRPGKYELDAGLTVAKLIANANGIKPDTYMERIDIYRYISDTNRKLITLSLLDESYKEFNLKEWDIVKIYTKQEIFGENFVEIYGALRNPGIYRLLEGMTASDLIFMAGLLHYSDSKEIEIIKKNTKERYTFALVPSENEVPNAYLSLERGDIINVKAIPELKVEKKVELNGKVRFPGIYIIQDKETLSQLIERAGGLVEDSFLSGMVFTRLSVKQKFQESTQLVNKEEQKQLIFDQTKFSGAEDEKEPLIYARANAYLQSKLAENNGRLIFNIKQLDDLKGSVNDLVLEDGDRITIPQIPSSIQVIGGVQIPGSLIYEQGKSIDYYIKNVGGYTEFALKKELMIIRANGVIEKQAKTVELGDTIYVPEKIKFPINWLKIVSTATTIIFNLATSIHIITLITN